MSRSVKCDECQTELHGYGFFFNLSVHMMHGVDGPQKDMERRTHDFCSLQCLEKWCPKELARVDEFSGSQLV